MYARVRLQRLDPGVERLGDVDPAVGLRRARGPDRRDAAPRLEPVLLELLPEHPTVAGVADRVEGGLAVGDVVGLVEVAPPQVSRKLMVTTTSGRCPRTTRRARGAGTPYSRTPSGRCRKSTSSTPTIRADSTCSASRTRPHSRGACRRCRPRRWSPCSRRRSCPARSTARRPRPRRTPCRRGAPRRTGRAASPRTGVRAVRGRTACLGACRTVVTGLPPLEEKCW